MTAVNQTYKRKPISRMSRAELEAELRRLREAADNVRMLAYGSATANDNGTQPPDLTTHFIYKVLGDLDEALGLERGTREVVGNQLHVEIPNVR